MSNTIVDTLHKIALKSDQGSSNANRRDMNRVFVLQRKGEFNYEDRPLPKLPSENHVIVAVNATGLCGSDIHYWQHGEIGDFKVRKPLVLGHESSGTIYKCGAAVKKLKEGDTVAIEPGVPCRMCQHCRGGKYNLCPDVVFAATPPHDGTLATYYAVPEDFCYLLPKSVSLEEGALIEPLSVAVHCTKLADLTIASTVLIFGAGPIGLLCASTARAYGATKVVVADTIQSRLDFARTYAATHVYRASNTTAEVTAADILSETEQRDGFQVVIDATGAEPCICAGIHALARGGKFIQAGLGAAKISFPVAQLCSKEGSYLASFRYGPGDYETAVQLLATGKVSVRELITHRFRFEDAEKAFENVVSRQGIKTIILGVGIDL